MNAPSRDFYEAYHREAPSHPIEMRKQARRREALRLLIPADPARTLFVGCGRGEELGIVRGRATAIDLSLTGLRVAAEHPSRPRLCEADVLHLPFRSDRFDTVICSEVIEHVVEADAAVQEMARVLGPGGRLVLSTPNLWSLFGLARCVGEAVTGKSITSRDQPYDRWSTPAALRALVRPYFEDLRWLGAWYFPPFGRGDRQISARLTVPLVTILTPFDRLFSRLLPWFGHLILLSARIRPRYSRSNR